MSGVPEPSACGVNAEEQRAEVLPRLPRLRPSADDELLLLDELDLFPRRRAASGLVNRRRLLCDQPFPLFLLRTRVERLCVARDLLAETDRLILRLQAEDPIEQSLEPLASFGQRKPGQILFAVSQNVERDERDRLRPVDALDVLRADEVNASLQPLKTGRASLRVERDDLAVEDQGRLQPRPRRFERTDDRRKLRRFLVAVARPDPGPRAGLRSLTGGHDLDKRANAVVLRLVEEAARRQGRIGDERGEHGPEVHKDDAILSIHAPAPQGLRPRVRIRDARAARARGVMAARHRGVGPRHPAEVPARRLYDRHDDDGAAAPEGSAAAPEGRARVSLYARAVARAARIDVRRARD